MLSLQKAMRYILMYIFHIFFIFMFFYNSVKYNNGRGGRGNSSAMVADEYMRANTYLHKY